MSDFWDLIPLETTTTDLKCDLPRSTGHELAHKLGRGRLYPPIVLYTTSVYHPIVLYRLPLPINDATWTQKWDMLEAWMTKHNLFSQEFLQGCRHQLPDIPSYILGAVLVKFFALVKQAKIEFDALAPTRNPFDIEVRAKQALRKVQQGIDQLCHQDVPTIPCAAASSPICAEISEHNTTRYICEWLFARVAGTLVRL